MKANGYTRIGESGDRFPTTHWAALREGQQGDDPHSRFLIAELARDYWKPIYCYLRRKGYGEEEAKDLTQGFFQEVVLGRALIQRADPGKGRFRTFLLTALDHYLANIHRRRAAFKRIPQNRLISLENVAAGDLPHVMPELTSEESFHYAWISDLLDRILRDVEADCRARGMAAHWEFFQERVLQPIMEDRTAPSLAELCAKHGIDEPMKASNMIFTVKRHLQAVLKRYVRQSVACDDEIGEEMASLKQFLARR